MAVGFQRDFLHKTQKIAQLFKKITIPESCSTPSHHSIPPPLNLSIPSYVTTELVDDSVLLELRNALRTAISDTQAQYRLAFEKAHQRASLQPMPQLRALQQLSNILENRFITQAIPGLIRHHTEAKAALAASATAADENRRTPKFNNVSPFLLPPIQILTTSPGLYPLPQSLLRLQRLSLPARPRSHGPKINDDLAPNRSLGEPPLLPPPSLPI